MPLSSEGCGRRDCRLHGSRANSYSKPTLFAPYPVLSPDSGERGLVCLISEGKVSAENRKLAYWSPLSQSGGGEWGGGCRMPTPKPPLSSPRTREGVGMEGQPLRDHCPVRSLSLLCLSQS